jgi:hypothetical protein
MSDSTHPTMPEILDALDRLADRVAESPSNRIDGFVSLSLRRAMEELRRYIPGLDLRPDWEAARFMLRVASSALEDGNAPEALSRSLRGLSLAPHTPDLWYLVASACFEYGSAEDAVRALRHTIWLNPGHWPARRDLGALNLYLHDPDDESGEQLPPPPMALADGNGWSTHPNLNALNQYLGDVPIAPTNTDGDSDDDFDASEFDDEDTNSSDD